MSAKRFDESEVRRLLQRAAEIDERNGRMISLEELKAIAREAGISTAAIEAAVHEGERVRAPEYQRNVLRESSVWSPLIGPAATGLSLGFLSILMEGTPLLPFFAGLLLTGATGTAAWSLFRRHSHGLAQARMFTLWAGVGAGVAFIRPYSFAHSLSQLLLYWAGSAAITFLLVEVAAWLRRRNVPEDDTGDHNVTPAAI